VTALVNPWPVVVPDRLAGGMAASIEADRTKAGAYPPEWPAAAWLVKTIADWHCERCGHEHTPTPPWVLTVHHLDGVKANLEHWNLSALCQRCHLRIQNRVIFLQDWPFEHSPWMARHVADYNEWAARNRRPALSLVGIAERSYEREWSA
jgi:hypothetical protein